MSEKDKLLTAKEVTEILFILHYFFGREQP
jgi:hypothetical protein